MSYFKVLSLVGFVLMAGCAKDSNDGPTGTANHAPIIRSMTAYPAEISRSGNTEITAIVTDEEGDSLTYYWACRSGSFSDRTGGTARWVASSEAGTRYVSLTVSDGKATDADSVAISVTTVPQNTPPTRPYAPSPGVNRTVNGPTVELTWSCDDADGDSLVYDVYFGTDAQLESLIFVRRDLSTRQTTATDIVSGGRQYYYWKVVARDSRGAEVVGETWYFQTNL